MFYRVLNLQRVYPMYTGEQFRRGVWQTPDLTSAGTLVVQIAQRILPGVAALLYHLKSMMVENSLDLVGEFWLKRKTNLYNIHLFRPHCCRIAAVFLPFVFSSNYIHKLLFVSIQFSSFVNPVPLLDKIISFHRYAVETMAVE